MPVALELAQKNRQAPEAESSPPIPARRRKAGLSVYSEAVGAPQEGHPGWPEGWAWPWEKEQAMHRAWAPGEAPAGRLRRDSERCRDGDSRADHPAWGALRRAGWRNPEWNPVDSLWKGRRYRRLALWSAAGWLRGRSWHSRDSDRVHRRNCRWRWAGGLCPLLSCPFLPCRSCLG